MFKWQANPLMQKFNGASIAAHCKSLPGLVSLLNSAIYVATKWPKAINLYEEIIVSICVEPDFSDCMLSIHILVTRFVHSLAWMFDKCYHS